MSLGEEVIGRRRERWYVYNFYKIGIDYFRFLEGKKIRLGYEESLDVYDLVDFFF